MSKDNLGDLIESLTPEESYGVGKHDLSKTYREKVRDALLKLRAVDIDIVRSIAESAANEVRDREAQEALDEMEAVARKYGFDVDELVRKKAEQMVAQQGTSEPVRFRHPNDAGLTWTGRGRLPAWLKEIKDAGGDIEKFRVRA